MALYFNHSREIKANYQSVTGYFVYKDTTIPYKNTPERDLLIYFSSLKEVLDIVPQPITLEFEENNRSYDYTPDFFVQFSTYNCTQKSLLIEVKPYEDWRLNWRHYSNKWKVAQAYAKEQGFEFRIYDENRIRHQALANLQFLENFKQLAVEKRMVAFLLEQIENRGVTTVETLLELYFKAGDYRKQGHRILFHLMALGLVDFDLWTSDIKNEQLLLWATNDDLYRFRPTCTI